MKTQQTPKHKIRTSDAPISPPQCLLTQSATSRDTAAIFRRPVVFTAILLVFLQLTTIGSSLWGLHYYFKHYSVEEGIAQTQVLCTLQTRDGYLWYAMYGGGLGRFNGRDFSNFRVKDGLCDNMVFSLYQDQNNILWIGTNQGLSRYDGKTLRCVNSDIGLPNCRILSISGDTDGVLWLGTYGCGLIRFDGKKIRSYTTKEGLQSNEVRSQLRARDGRLWIATTAGLNHLEGDTVVQGPLEKEIGNINLRHILEDSRGNMWFSSKDGLFQYDGSRLQHFTTKDGLSHNFVRHGMQDRDGNYWFATFHGVNRYTDGKFTVFSTEQGLLHNDVNRSMEDREGNLWFSTERGMSRYNGGMFSLLTQQEGLPNDTTWCFWESGQQELWISTERGIGIYNPQTQQSRKITGIWGPGIPYPFFEDSKGNLWFGDNEELFLYKDGKAVNMSRSNSFGPMNAFAVFEDAAGNIWVGTQFRGVFKYDGRQVVNFTLKDGLPDMAVNAVIQDHKGHIWLGTAGGIAIYDGGMFTTVSTDSWLPNKHVISLQRDGHNNIWIGTYGNGVIRYTHSGHIGKGRTVTFTALDGLVDEGVVSMIFDDQKTLWIGTIRGLSSIDVPLFNRTGRKSILQYGREDGFAGLECNQNAIFKAKDGSVWFGTIKGALRCERTQKRINRVEPMLRIDQVKLFFTNTPPVEYSSDKSGNSTLPPDLTLPYNRNHLTFHFTGISLTVPERVRYRVKLEGFDDNWSPPSQSSFAVYSNIPPGDYVFMVKACNNSGLWNTNPAKYSFRVQPPFWQTWWFYVIALLCFVGGIGGYIRLRVSKFKHMQTYLEKQVHLRTIQLEQEKEKVEGINRELEDRVEERTRKLAVVNKQLIRAQKMEAIGTLAGGVAHDLNNVLAGIVGYPELLLLDMPEDSPYHKSITTIQMAGERAAAIVQDMLTLARRGVSISESVQLNKIIKEFINSPECAKILSYHPSVTIHTKPDLDAAMVMGSAIHLSKCLMNLVSNAAEAMSSNGDITIATVNRYITVEEQIEGCGDHKIPPGNYVLLTVEDTGSGIAEDDLEHIFEPFYTKKQMGRSGTGLGMTVVWGTVKDHDGFIGVTSKEGKGTIFYLYFPATVVPSPRPVPSLSVEQLMGDGQSILVVDDVEDQKNITVLMLEKLNYKLHSVSRGEDAVEYIQNTPVVLLVLDMIMDPGISGLETYKRILRLYPRQKAVIVSGYTETDEVKKALKLGAGAYLRKPFSLRQLGSAVKEALADKTTMEE